jgi:hypothetical protein
MMTRIGTTLVALGVWGVLLGAGEALACRGHGAEAEAQPAAVEPGGEPRAAQASPEAGEPEQVAAKCRCSSAAECTCKKGTCECSKCKKPKRQVVEPLKAQGRTPRRGQARYDASAGILL